MDRSRLFMKKVLFISSTGGHFNEMMRLEPMFNKYDSYIATDSELNSVDNQFTGDVDESKIDVNLIL